MIIRFAETLPADSYRVTVVGQGTDGVHTYYAPDGKAVKPLINTAGIPVQFGEITSNGQTYWDGRNVVWSFDLNLAPQVTSVVPQPITRNANGTLVQHRDQIEVYFSEKMDVNSAQDAAFYSLIATGQTADTSDDVAVHPTAVVYDDAAQKVTLSFDADQNGNSIDDLAELGVGAFRCASATNTR